MGSVGDPLSNVSESQVPPERTKVLYLAGWGRSGTTILANILGSVDDLVSVGELHYVWSRGFEPDWLCGCGVPVAACPYWSAVFAASFGGREAADLEGIRAAESEVRSRRILALWRSARQTRAGPYGRALARIYSGITAIADARVVVDSSKDPADAIVVAGIPECDLYVVHMVRDPRAVAFSWSRRKVSPTNTSADGLLDRVGWLRSTLVWLAYNIAIDVAVRSLVRDRLLRVRYEDFVADPLSTVNAVAAFADLPAVERDGKPFVENNAVALGVTHTVSGNPDRFKTGVVTVRPDDEWRISMPRTRQLAIAAIAAPVMIAYGYRLTPGGAG